MALRRPERIILIETPDRKDRNAAIGAFHLRCAASKRHCLMVMVLIVQHRGKAW